MNIEEDDLVHPVYDTGPITFESFSSAVVARPAGCP